MISRTATIILLFCCITTRLWAQNHFKFDDTLRNINLRIVDTNTKEPIGLAHIFNTTQHQGEISDLLGYLTIPIAFGDSLTVTAIGYNAKKLFNWGQFKHDSLYYDIPISPKVYEIKEVKISRFTTYDRFLKEVANLKLPKSKEYIQLERLQWYLFGIVKKSKGNNLPGSVAGIGFGEDWYHKQNVKLAELKDKEIDKRSIEQKYNPGIIQELTGLSGDEFYKFMAELDFTDKQLLELSDYEIREKILKKFSDYKTRKQPEEIKANE